MSTKDSKTEQPCTIHSVRRSALVQWLSDEYPIEEAEEQIDNAKITENDGEITIEYDNGVKDIVEFIGDKVVKLF